jgi:hypothetical protein
MCFSTYGATEYPRPSERIGAEIEHAAFSLYERPTVVEGDHFRYWDIGHAQGVHDPELAINRMGRR